MSTASEKHFSFLAEICANIEAQRAGWNKRRVKGNFARLLFTNMAVTDCSYKPSGRAK